MYEIKFLKEFLCNPARVGAVAPSSRSLAQAVTRAAGVSDASIVVEFGPGTGAITEVILEEKQPDATFFALELDADFVETLHERFPGVTVHNDSAQNTRQYLERAGHDACDCIVSGLPWASFPEDLQDSLLDTIQDVLRPGGRFATYMYAQSRVLASGVRFRTKLGARFGRYRCSRIVWKNFPPAVVYHVQK